MEYYNVIPNFCFVFHLDTLTLAKSDFSKISLTPNFEIQTIFELFTGKTMVYSGLEAQQSISDVK